MADYMNSNDYQIQSTGGMTQDPTTGLYTDQYGNQYDANGVKVGSTTPTQKSSYQAQAAPAAGGGGAGGIANGALRGASTGAAVSGGNPYAAGADAIIGGVSAGLEESPEETEVTKNAEQKAKRQTERDRAFYENRGANDVVGIATGKPIIDTIRAKSLLGRDLKPEEIKYINQTAVLGENPYNTVSGDAMIEGKIYNNQLKALQKQQKLRQQFTFGLSV